MEAKEIGNLGEKIAEEYLKKQGYKILKRNYIPKFLSGPQRGEIDIVAKKKDTLFFVEVKTLLASSVRGRFGSFGIFPEEKVNFSKQQKIIRAAESWLIGEKISLDRKWQIDVISIIINAETKKARLRHLKNAVS